MTEQQQQSGGLDLNELSSIILSPNEQRIIDDITKRQADAANTLAAAIDDL